MIGRLSETEVPSHPQGIELGSEKHLLHKVDGFVVDSSASKRHEIREDDRRRGFEWISKDSAVLSD